MSDVRKIGVTDLTTGIEELASHYGLPIGITAHEVAGDAAELQGPEEWSYQIEAELLDQAVAVEVNQSQVEGAGPFDGWVTAHRTRLSVLLGIVTAMAWHTLAGGDLSGTGLDDQALTDGEGAQLLREILAPGSDVRAAANRAAERLGCSVLPPV